MTHQTTQTGALDLATKDELAARLKVSLRHVTNLTRRGIIPSIKLGRTIRFDAARVLAALNAGGTS